MVTVGLINALGSGSGQSSTSTSSQSGLTNIMSSDTADPFGVV